MSKVIIFRNHLLPISETFIAAQVRTLKIFEAQYVGLVHSEYSLPLPNSAIFLCGPPSRLSRLLIASYKLAAHPRGRHSCVRKSAAKLMHAHFAIDGTTALPLLTYLGIPLVVTLHGYDVTTTDRAFRRTLGGRIYLARRGQLWKKASVFLCVSDFIRTKAIEAGFPREKLRVHYTGIDQSLFESDSNQTTRNSVLFVGRLVEKKGCTHLLAAMSEVQKRHENIRLIVVGMGPLANSLKEQARALSLNCHFMGMQTQDEIRQLLRSAKVFCVPSITASSGDSEGLGMVFAEAQAMGVPVVSFHHGGIPEVVRHGETGFLAPEGDVSSLAKYLELLLEDDELWSAVSLMATSWVKQQFDIVKQTKELEVLYDQVIKASGIS